MKKIGIVALFGLAVGGCNATVSQPVIYSSPRPVVYTAPVPVYNVPPQRIVPRVSCYSVWDRTPRGLVERRVCQRSYM